MQEKIKKKFLVSEIIASELHLKRSTNMVRVLSCKFQQCLGAFTMFLSKRSLETGRYIH